MLGLSLYLLPYSVCASNEASGKTDHLFVILCARSIMLIFILYVPDRVAKSVTCLTADPGVTSLIPAWSRTFMEIDHEIISEAILLPSADSRRVIVSYKWKYVQEVHIALVNCFFKLAQEKKCGREN